MVGQYTNSSSADFAAQLAANVCCLVHGESRASCSIMRMVLQWICTGPCWTSEYSMTSFCWCCIVYWLWLASFGRRLAIQNFGTRDQVGRAGTSFFKGRSRPTVSSGSKCIVPAAAGASSLRQSNTSQALTRFHANASILSASTNSAAFTIESTATHLVAVNAAATAAESAVSVVVMTVLHARYL